MNCREAQSQMYANGAGAGGDSPSAPLAAHVAHCAACRRIQDDLAAAITAWRTGTSEATIPDAEREWHAVRRLIRQGAEGSSAGSRLRGNWLALVTWPLAAAAAAAVLFVSLPRPNSRTVTFSEPSVRADFVEAPGRNASTMVIVDDQSGWLIVWASDASPREG